MALMLPVAVLKFVVNVPRLDDTVPRLLDMVDAEVVKLVTRPETVLKFVVSVPRLPEIAYMLPVAVLKFVVSVPRFEETVSRLLDMVDAEVNNFPTSPDIVAIFAVAALKFVWLDFVSR